MLRRKSLGTPFVETTVLNLPNYTIQLIRDRCKGCEVCVEFCPRNILEMSTDFNSKGYHMPRLVENNEFSDCSGCMFCEIVCPEFAIFINEVKKT